LLVSCAGTAFATTTTQTDYAISSGSVTIANSDSVTYTASEENWGADCYEIGLLLGYTADDYDSEENAFEDDGYYEAFGATAKISGSAQFTNKGEITFLDSAPDEGGYRRDYTSCVLISGNAKFVNDGTVDFDDQYIVLSDSADLTNSASGTISDVSTLIMVGNSSFTNNGTLAMDYGKPEISITDNAKFENNGEITGNYVDVNLTGNGSFTNNGDINARPYVYFNFQKDGSATFVNNGSMNLNDGIGYELSEDDDYNETISNKFTGTFENHGEITTSYPYLDVYADIYIYKETQKSSWDLDLSGKMQFKNYGTIVADSVTIDSFVETTLVQGSQIKGDLELGNATECYYEIAGSDDSWKHGQVEIVADKTILNIVLNDSSSADPLVSGSITLYTDTTLNVSVDPDSKQLKYTVTLWGDELILDSQRLYSSDSSSTTTGNINTSGTFLRGDETFTWNLNKTTGVLTAVSENLTETEITDPDSDIYVIDKNSVATFDSSLTEFSGKIHGAGQVYSEADITFKGDASDHTGPTYVEAGTFTIAAEAVLSSGTYSVSSGAVLEIASSREFANATSGDGTLRVASRAKVNFTSNIGVKTVEVANRGTLDGGVTLTHKDAVLNLDGTLSLGVGESVTFTNGGTAVLGSTAALSIKTNDLSGAKLTIFSGATVQGDIVSFLSSESDLAYLAATNAVVYDTSNGLSVTVVSSPSALLAGVKMHNGLGSDFLDAVIDESALDFGTGFVSAESLQSDDPLVNAILSGSGSAGGMLTTLSPLSYAALVAIPATSFHNDVRKIESRLATQRRIADEQMYHWGFESPVRWNFFAQAEATFMKNDSGSDKPVFDFDTYGVLVGADCQISESLTAGLSVAYDTGKAKIHDGGGKIDCDDFRITLYGGGVIADLFFINAGAQFGYGSFDAKRKTVYGRATGNTNVWSGGVFADAGMLIDLSKDLGLSLRPYVGIAYMRSQVEKFSDSQYNIDDFSGDSLRARVGIGLYWDFDVAGTNWALGVDGSYSHDFLGDDVDIDAAVRGSGASFSATAEAMPKNIFSVGPVLSIAITENLGMFAAYTFEAGTDSSIAHNVNVGVKLSF
ncbi:MAG: autotransporter domain-containing protein, partial [Opitutae bacterium]|nr:autotransporter domain-containing protein [Opitutae bacterium]